MPQALSHTLAPGDSGLLTSDFWGELTFWILGDASGTETWVADIVVFVVVAVVAPTASARSGGRSSSSLRLLKAHIALLITIIHRLWEGRGREGGEAKAGGRGSPNRRSLNCKLTRQDTRPKASVCHRDKPHITWYLWFEPLLNKQFHDMTCNPSCEATPLYIPQPCPCLCEVAYPRSFMEACDAFKVQQHCGICQNVLAFYVEKCSIAWPYHNFFMCLWTISSHEPSL